MDADTLLTTRTSNGKLTEPAPDAEALRLAFEAAARAPDHASLQPVRVRVIRGAARERLGELMAASLLRHNPQAPEEELARARKKALRAPLILVVGAALRAHPKVPEIEQTLSAGAAAHAILLALFARGYGAIWRTGDIAYDPDVKHALGFDACDAIVGFIYAGTPSREAPELHRPRVDEFVSEWSGPLD